MLIEVLIFFVFSVISALDTGLDCTGPQDLSNYYYFPELFTADQVEQILQTGRGIREDSGLISGTIGSGDIDTVIRDSRVMWLNRKNTESWVFNKVHAAVNSANCRVYHVDVNYTNFWYLQYSVYDEHHPFYDWHMDVGPEFPDRKLSAVVFLSQPEVDYTGGSFQFKTKAQEVFPEMRKGSAIVFPSFFLHKVNPVTSGERHTLAAWITGPQWK